MTNTRLLLIVVFALLATGPTRSKDSPTSSTAAPDGSLAPGVGFVVDGAPSSLRTYTPEAFGATHGSDDGTAIDAVLAAAKATCGVVVLGPWQYHAPGRDVVIPSCVHLMGQHRAQRQSPSADYTKLPYSLFLDSAHTLRVLSDAQASNLVLVREGIAVPTDMRSGINAVAAMAGTGVTLGNAGRGMGRDAALRSVTIVGFNLCVLSNGNPRPDIEDLLGDCRNGLALTGAHDIARVRDTQFWPLTTASQPWTDTRWAVTGAADNGAGLIRLTTTAAADLVTGDMVHVHGVEGATAANNRWIVAPVDRSHIDLRGSSSTGLSAYTSGGTVEVSLNRRAGTAFDVTNCDWALLQDPFGYGYDTTFHIGSAANFIQVVAGKADNLTTLADPNTIAVLLDGTADGMQWVGGMISSQARAIVNNSTGKQAHVFSGAQIHTNGRGGIDASTGSLVLAGVRMSIPSINVADAITRLTLAGIDAAGTMINPASNVARGKIVHAGDTTFASGSPRVGNPVVQSVTTDKLVVGGNAMTTPALVIASSANGDPSGGAQIKLQNTTVGAANAVKTVRLTRTGTLQVVDAANSAVVLLLTDAGNLQAPAGAIGAGTSLSAKTHLALDGYAVSSLPACTAGQTTYATNGRNNGQAAGSGTGLLVTCDSGNTWRAPWSGADVTQ